MVSRREDLDTFYQLLADLEKREGGKFRLRDCSRRMSWPQYAVCFYFEPGEYRENEEQMRVVRISIPNCGAKEKNTLWERLSRHRGTVAGKFSGGGNHRESVFRFFVGSAIMKRDSIRCETWGQGDKANTRIRKAEHMLEVMVSKKMASMEFV